MTSKKAFITTTALVLCISASIDAAASENPGKKVIPPFATAQADQRQGGIFRKLARVDRNARFLAWFGYVAPHNASTLLYAQSASSGFSTYAISSWGASSSWPSCNFYSPMAADDFIIPGSGSHKITAVYAPGVLAGAEPSYIHLTFFDALKYNKRTRKLTLVIKVTCDTRSFSDTNGHGDFLADVGSCNLGRFRSGHDYSISVQPCFLRYGSWAWQTNRNQIKRQAFFVANNGSGPCNSYFAPVKTCFPQSGYGPDLAFAIYGK